MALELTQEELERLHKHLETCKKIGKGKEASPEKMEKVCENVRDGKSVAEITKTVHCGSRLIYRARRQMRMRRNSK